MLLKKNRGCVLIQRKRNFWCSDLTDKNTLAQAWIMGEIFL
jgi:hypothetical protein